MSSCSWKKMGNSTAFLVLDKGFFAAVLLGIGLLFSVTSPARAQSGAGGKASIAGMWLVQEKDGIFRVAPCQGDVHRFCGTLVGMDYTESEPAKDSRGRSECGLEIVSDLTRRKDGRWRGKILDPRSGNRYQAAMWLADANTLKLRGYLGLDIFGETQTWSRVTHPAIGARCRMKKNG